MGRWHSIVERKTTGNIARGKVFAKMSRIIEIAAKKGWDPDLNPALAVAITKAKQNGVTRDIIERAIKKWSWQLGWEAYLEVFYEWYGPSGSALYIKTLTDNGNRTSTNVRTTMQKYGGTMAEIGAVARQFEQKWIIVIDGLVHKEMVKGNEVETTLPYGKDQLEMDAIEAWAEDIASEGNAMVITTSKSDFASVLRTLTDKSYHVIQSDIEALPSNIVTLSDEDRATLDTLVAMIEDDDDVEKVRTNIA